MDVVVLPRGSRRPGRWSGPIVLVIGPTRELVLQIALEAEKFKAAAGIMVGVATRPLPVLCPPQTESVSTSPNKKTTEIVNTWVKIKSIIYIFLSINDVIIPAC